MGGVKGNEMKQHVQHAVLKQHAVTAKHWLKRMEKGMRRVTPHGICRLPVARVLQV